MIPKNQNLPVNIGDLCRSCAAFAAPFVKAYQSFHDEDHEGDDKEGRRLSALDSDDCIDES